MRVMVSIAAIVTFVVILTLLAPRLSGSALARTPTAPPTPTSTPIPPGAVRVRVVGDFNRNGVQDPGDPGEQGIPGSRIEMGCGDARSSLTTDTHGEAIGVRSDSALAYQECFTLEREFGWLPITPLRLQVAPNDPAVNPQLTFFVHVLGATVMEISGEVIDRGVPAATPQFSRLALPFRGTNVGCVESFGRGGGWTLIVVGDDQRQDCPGASNSFGVELDGAPASVFQFEPGKSVGHAFVEHGDSMRVYTTLADGARVNGIDCAYVLPIDGFVPPEYVRIFVLSDEARPGCGAPGRAVRFYKKGQPLDPPVAWVPGDQGALPELAVVTVPPILPPNTGSAGLLGSR